MKITDLQITQMCENLPTISAFLWDWDYDGASGSSIKVEKEICVYDDDDNDLYFFIEFDLKRDYEGHLTDCEFKINSIYNVRSDEVKLTAKQEDKILTWLEIAIES